MPLQVVAGFLESERGIKDSGVRPVKAMIEKRSVFVSCTVKAALENRNDIYAGVRCRERLVHRFEACFHSPVVT